MGKAHGLDVGAPADLAEEENSPRGSDGDDGGKRRMVTRLFGYGGGYELAELVRWRWR